MIWYGRIKYKIEILSAALFVVAIVIALNRVVPLYHFYRVDKSQLVPVQTGRIQDFFEERRRSLLEQIVFTIAGGRELRYQEDAPQFYTAYHVIKYHRDVTLWLTPGNWHPPVIHQIRSDGQWVVSFEETKAHLKRKLILFALPVPLLFDGYLVFRRTAAARRLFDRFERRVG